MSPETILSSRLQDDKTWRIRELSELVRACRDADQIRKDALLRASIPLIYAHWEGYFVFAANSYLGFISEKNIKLSLLKEQFWAISIRKQFKPSQVGSDKNFSRFLVSVKSQPDRIFRRGIFEKIHAASNLNYDVLRFCLECLSIDSKVFEGYKEFIDKELLDRRNHIAHGASIRVEPDDLPDYGDKVVDLLRIVHNEIENSAVSGGYLK